MKHINLHEKFLTVKRFRYPFSNVFHLLFKIKCLFSVKLSELFTFCLTIICMKNGFLLLDFSFEVIQLNQLLNFDNIRQKTVEKPFIITPIETRDTMNESILHVSQLTKTIKKTPIIHDVSFDIQEGEILGFLGPNGSGKTTTLRMVVGLIRPTSGDIHICGYSLKKDYIKAMRNVGCIIEGPDLYGYMSGYKNLELLGSMSENVTKADIDEAVALVGMENRIHDKVDVYSMGMKQRIGLAQALIHKPRLLILDEPTNGLDPQGIHEFREIVKKLAKDKGISVLISSHLISEVQLMCDRVSIINKGRIIKNASIEEMLSTGEVIWTLDDPVKGQAILENTFKLSSTIDQRGLRTTIDISRLPDINRTFFAAGLEISFVDNKKQTLEDLFLSLTHEEKI